MTCQLFADLKSLAVHPLRHKNIAVILLGNRGYHLLALCRIQSRLYRHRPLRIFAIAVRFLINNFYGCYISPTAQLGTGVRFPHPVGIVIGDGARVGSSTTIFQNVTLGSKHQADPRYPSLGKNCTVGAGAVILGEVSIGEGAIIGANSVVVMNVPAGCRAAGIPAKVLADP